MDTIKIIKSNTTCIIDTILVDSSSIPSSKYTETTVLINQQKDQNTGLLNISHNTWASIVVSLFTFFLGLAIAYVSKKWSIANKMSNQQVLIAFWVDSIEDPIKRQASALREFALALKSPDSLPNQLGRVGLHLDKLLSISPSEHVQLFITNKEAEEVVKQKMLYRYSSALDLLERVQKNHSASIEALKNMGLKYQSNWQEEITALTDLYTNIFNHYESGDKSDFILAIIKVRIEWIKQVQHEAPEAATPVASTKKFFIDKIKPILEAQFEKSPNTPFLQDLYKIVNKLEITYMRKVVNFNKMGDQFNATAKQIESAYIDMKESKDQLVKMPFLFFLFQK